MTRAKARRQRKLRKERKKNGHDTKDDSESSNRVNHQPKQQNSPTSCAEETFQMDQFSADTSNVYPKHDYQFGVHLPSHLADVANHNGTSNSNQSLLSRQSQMSDQFLTTQSSPYPPLPVTSPHPSTTSYTTRGEVYARTMSLSVYPNFATNRSFASANTELIENRRSAVWHQPKFFHSVNLLSIFSSKLTQNEFFHPQLFS
eukprot:TRINITY_DN7683_c0_g1_i1.p1 TRINITY_DN7683_c0_g1~~TRINITY_DN7683_c0_g1_i1.p1  ORF type:complete len:202 (-),score=22.28 TRINITY_DN7683_c0_g1_i1:151-756(-)